MSFPSPVLFNIYFSFCFRAALRTAERCNLSVDKHGDVSVLSRAIGSSWNYAKMILEHMKSGDTEKLFTRDTRSDAIKASEYPKLLAGFAKDPENSRAVPGNDTVSVGYKVRAPKFILIKSRVTVMKAFKEKYPDCKFSLRVLNREWPQNVVTPTSRDLDRNVCPIHSNARRLETALRKQGLLQQVPSSCRLMCSQAMCQKEGVQPLDPLTWDPKCVKGECKDCPENETEVPMEISDKIVTVALWGTKHDKVKNKKINNIHDYDFTLSQLVAKFDKELPKLTRHIFTAAHQWKAAKLTGQNLTPEIIETIEDFQQNLSLSHQEETTTAHFTSNVVQVACYPCIIKYMKEGDEKPRKEGMVFLSSDRKHDFQQVEVFEKEVFEYMKEKVDVNPKIWIRWSDQCSAQFKSQYTVEKLRVAGEAMGLCEGCQVDWNYFEVITALHHCHLCPCHYQTKLFFCRWEREKMKVTPLAAL